MTKDTFFVNSRDVLLQITLLTVGCSIYAFGVKSILVPQEFISGGIFGLGMLIYYASGILSPAILYGLLNIPLFIAGWAFLSRRFFFYSLYGMAITTVAAEYITYVMPLKDPLISAITAGCICGVGLGIIFHSKGCDGGTSVIASIVHDKYGIKIGTLNLVMNLFIFALALFYLDFDKIMYSVVFIYVTSYVTDSVLSMFNQRKLVFIISEHNHAIADAVLKQLNRGATFIQGHGAFSGAKKDILMVVIHNHQIKQIESLIFQIDQKAFVIIENTFNVLGTGFSKVKKY
ncbi:YitT family protein [Desulfovibrio litoralis]|uniref:Uncharacterized membrane-anchored protein YitT, contains DUF161 and DUF2179 domains n=1 Tax=Desulfovibrio litoralis DSM 11393 TaxID=1121455 RepID=A0A1M7TF36_9BACT|nr:YitT family protein [Desulfovibrio litoralis]SHN69263.1 Uncharacterized membrane-anchored protein YitT, contains DUF161 and DUF2179 domains [Desulfovibrio litoralis DSM 11393]